MIPLFKHHITNSEISQHVNPNIINILAKNLYPDSKQLLGVTSILENRG